MVCHLRWLCQNGRNGDATNVIRTVLQWVWILDWSIAFIDDVIAGFDSFFIRAHWFDADSEIIAKYTREIIHLLKTARVWLMEWLPPK